MKRFLAFLASVTLFAACTTDTVFVTISADSQFVDGKATVNLKLSKTAPDFVDVLIAVTPSEGFSYNEQVTVNPGTQMASVVIDAVGINPTEDINVQVRIKEAIGAVPGVPSSATIVLKAGNYGGGGGGGNDPAPTGFTLVSGWSAQMVSAPYTDEYGHWVDVEITAPGIKYYFPISFLDGTVTDLALQFRNLEQELADLKADGEDILEYIWPGDGDYDCWVEYPGAGAATIYIPEFDATGKLTGRYGATKVTMPELNGGGGGGEEELDFTGYTLMPNWTVRLNGEPYIYDGYGYFDVIVNAPGIKYFWLEAELEGDITYYYDGWDEMVKSWESEFVEMLKEDVIGNILWTSSDTDIWTYYMGEGEQKIYLVEFDENGHATGRYGVSDVNVPKLEGLEEDAPAAGAPAVRFRAVRKTGRSLSYGKLR